MLLRQALEQTRAGMPKPVLFNSSIVVIDPTDEVFVMAQKEILDVHWHSVHNRASIRPIPRGFAGQVRQGQLHRRAATDAAGAQAS